MFTGIVMAVGRVAEMAPRGGDVRLAVDTGGLELAGARIGDSIAVNGVCLTAVAVQQRRFTADVSLETLARTNLGRLSAGAPVNLELALRVGDRLGGHLVSGHVDGVGDVCGIENAARSQRMTFAAPAALARYIAEKGSICIDGVSLTVNGVNGAEFAVNVVPHTLTATTLGHYAVGQAVNIEVDVLARYVERLMHGERAATPEITTAFLAEHGFLK